MLRWLIRSQHLANIWTTLAQRIKGDDTILYTHRFTTYESIEKFTIIQDPHATRNVDIMTVLWISRIELPALRELKLINITATCDTLRLFLSLIQWPLKSLTIEEPSMSPSQWEEAKAMVLDGDCVQPKGAMDIIMTKPFYPDCADVQEWYANKTVIP